MDYIGIKGIMKIIRKREKAEEERKKKAKAKEGFKYD